MKYQSVKRLLSTDIKTLSTEQLYKYRAKLVDAYYSVRGDCGEAQLFKDGFVVPLESESASGFVPKDKFMYSNICFQLGECEKRLGAAK